MPCESWCNEFTCLLQPCTACGPSKGCSVAKYGQREDLTTSQGFIGVSSSRQRCAAWCSQYTCSQSECLDCGVDNGCEGREPPSPPHPPPHPLLPPIDLVHRRPSDYFTYGASLHTNAWIDAGPIKIHGASWFGMETEACVIGGAQHLPIETIAEWLSEQGFNAVRLPLAADAILNPRHPCTLKGDVEAVRNRNFAFGSMQYLDQVAELARVAGESGLLVLLDMHVLVAGKWPDGGSVYGGGRQQLFSAWDRLAELLCDPDDYWNVFAADLKNEPYGMAWGDASSASTWSELATALGVHLHAKCPRWAIFVEGVGECADAHSDAGCLHPSAGEHQNMHLHAGTWWGENLQAAVAAPVTVQDAESESSGAAFGKTVYSPHTYGPSTHHQVQFDDSAFPSNMPRIWDAQFGHLARDARAPVVIGEFGGLCNGLDATLQRALVEYMRDRGIGGFWWALNPESADTGGLIQSWAEGSIMTPESTKLTILSSLPSSRVPRTRERTSPSHASARAEAPTSPPARSSPLIRSSPLPPEPPSPPPPPPPPFTVEVRRIFSPSGPPIAFGAFGHHRWPPLPPVPSPPPPSMSMPLRADAHHIEPNAHSWARSPPPLIDTQSGGGDGSDWLVPGIVLAGWGGAAQLLLLIVGGWALWQMAPSLRDERATAGVRPKPARRQRKKGKRWEHVPTDADPGRVDADTGGGEVV